MNHAVACPVVFPIIEVFSEMPVMELRWSANTMLNEPRMETTPRTMIPIEGGRSFSSVATEHPFFHPITPLLSGSRASLAFTPTLLALQGFGLFPVEVVFFPVCGGLAAPLSGLITEPDLDERRVLAGEKGRHS